MQLPLYLDYAATTPVLPEVWEAMQPYFSQAYGNAGAALHLYGWQADEALAQARQSIAQSLGLQSRQIIFTSGATESIHLGIQGYLATQAKGHLICSAMEHKAVLSLMQHLEQEGWALTCLAGDAFGRINAEELRQAIRPDTRLISIQYVNNETGLIQAIPELYALAKSMGIPFHSDITQALGKCALEVLPDLLSFSAHKLYGPKGIGALVLVNESLSIQPLLYGGGQERGLRSGTVAVPLAVGFGKAALGIPKYLAKQESHAAWTQALRQALNQTLGEAIVWNQDPSCSVASLLNFSVKGLDWEGMFQALPDLALSNGSACNAKTQLPSPVLLHLGRSPAQALASIRLCLGYPSQASEVDYILDYLPKQLKQLLDKQVS